MGWTFTNFDVPAGGEIDYLVNRSGCLSWTSMPVEQRPTVKAIMRKGSTIFVALTTPRAYFEANPNDLKNYPYRRDVDGSITEAVIVLTKRDGGSFGYKDVSESGGPYVPAPLSFLKHLSVLDSNNPAARYALAWRERCHEAAKVEASTRRVLRTVKPGDRVELASPVFIAKEPHTKFIAVERTIRRGKTIAPTIVYEPINSSYFVKLTRKMLAGAKITPALAAAA